MEINKRCISAFARTESFVAFATKSKLFDPTFSLTSELILVNYMTGKFYSPVTTELKFCKIMWCEFNSISYLVAGHENGAISIYNKTDEGLVLLKSKTCMEGDITALDFLPSKAVLVAGSSKGKIIFWTLSNLEKEYSLDIPLSVNISAIAWNPKVSKILCVGTSDGIIKVLDIKKNSIIMTLSSKDFSEIKQLEWDRENNTRLIVMSEKGYLNVFDLSNDSVARVGSHTESLIGFCQDLLVSKNLLENKGCSVPIADSFDCSISKKDPVIALSHTNGTTKIISIPFVKRTIPFYRHRSFIVTPTARYEVKITNPYEETHDDRFYSTLLTMLYSDDKIDMKIVGDFLLENSNSINDKYLDPESSIHVNIDDPLSLSLIKGNLSKLKDCKAKIDISLLDTLFTKDVSSLKNITDFPSLFIFSKILNDYSLLSGVDNPRILAALLIFNDINDFSILSKSKEALMLKGLFMRKPGEYIDNRAISEPNYLRRMKKAELYTREILELSSKPLSSSCLVEYFWYKILMNEFEDVKDIKVADKDVEYFIKVNTSAPALIDKMKGFNLNKQGTAKAAATPLSYGQKGTPVQLTQEPMSNAPPQASNSASLPAFAAIPKNPLTSRNYNYNVPPAGQGPSYIPKPTETSPRAFPTSSPFSRTSSAQGFSTPTASNFPKSPFMGNIPQPQMSPGIRSPPMSISQPFKPMPSSSMSSSIPRPPSGMGIPQKPTGISSPSMSSSISRPSSIAGVPQRPIGMPSIPSPSCIVHNVSNKSLSNLQISNPGEIVSNFESTITDLKEKAASKTSLILRQRKIQYLGALGTYNSIDKSNIPNGILNVMDLITKRLQFPDGNLKIDLDTLIDGFSDVLWLKAAVELAKMVY